MKSVDLLQASSEQYIRGFGWVGGHAQNIKDITIALLKCDSYIPENFTRAGCVYNY